MEPKEVYRLAAQKQIVWENEQKIRALLEREKSASLIKYQFNSMHYQIK